MNEMQLFRQAGLDLRIHLIDHVLGAYHGGINAGYDFFEEFHITVFSSDNSLPVPLVHVEGVEVTQFFIGANGVHVGIDAVAGFDIVFGQRQSLPFGQ